MQVEWLTSKNLQVFGRKTCKAMHRLVSFCKKLASSYKITNRPRPGYIAQELEVKQLMKMFLILNFAKHHLDWTGNYLNWQKSKETVAIFLDLSKAFNSISHNIFLKKIEMYGFSQEAKELLFSFLANRRQKVNLMAYSLIVKFWITVCHKELF